MQLNQFFLKKGPFSLKEIANNINCTGDFLEKQDNKIYNIESLVNASEKDITFFNSIKYREASLQTKALACITTSNLLQHLPDQCIKLNVKNVLFAVTLVSKMFYPKADIDFPDENLIDSDELKDIYPNVKFGKNVLIGKNVKLGKNSHIGSNSIIESHVIIGENCVIGSFVTIRNSLIANNVNIQDGCKVGVKGFQHLCVLRRYVLSVWALFTRNRLL